jgi:hypothetical protein
MALIKDRWEYKPFRIYFLISISRTKFTTRPINPPNSFWIHWLIPPSPLPSLDVPQDRFRLFLAATA